ncbi:MAG: sodium:proton antiporter NhaD [Bacteroidota bacterium]
MTILLVIVFCLGYLAIVFEHQLEINKAAAALVTGILCWTVLGTFQPAASEAGLMAPSGHTGNNFIAALPHHVVSAAEILFFLLGAMTIVEVIDAHKGFAILTNRIRTRNIRQLLWIVGIATFFLSAVLDNLTTAIVMASLIRKLIPGKELRLTFAGAVIIAANAGGAWSPIGDVTTTMLWIGGQISAEGIMRILILPSLVSLAIPLLWFTFKLKGQIPEVPFAETQVKAPKGANIFLLSGLGGLVLVPVFKTLTGLPPFMGVLLALGIVWLIADILHKKSEPETRKKYSAAEALSRTDTASILFFFGILLAIGALETPGLLKNAAEWLNGSIGNQDVIVIAIGLLSAIIDNVPLVAACMGMYDPALYQTDHKLWEFIAYCAGTGGSVLIIGSAAGVAVMGMEKIDFGTYMKKISLPALVGYLAGAGAYLALYSVIH